MRLAGCQKGVNGRMSRKMRRRNGKEKRSGTEEEGGREETGRRTVLIGAEDLDLTVLLTESLETLEDRSALFPPLSVRE